MKYLRSYDKIINVYAKAVKKAASSKQLRAEELSIFVKNIEDVESYVHGMFHK